jgi:hypothetical protein
MLTRLRDPRAEGLTRPTLAPASSMVASTSTEPGDDAGRVAGKAGKTPLVN